MKTGDKVIVPAEINGYGRDLRAIVTEIEKFAGAIFVTVIFTEPCPEACGRRGLRLAVGASCGDRRRGGRILCLAPKERKGSL